jgi:DNA-binding NarL/FixJ family response regulator
MHADDLWAPYLRLQQMARHSKTTDNGWAIDEALDFAIEEIAAGRRPSDTQIKNVLSNRAAKYRNRRRITATRYLPQRVAPSTDARIDVGERLKLCSSRDRQILTSLASGFSVKELATEHEVPTGTIKTWAHRARIKIAV